MRTITVLAGALLAAGGPRPPDQIELRDGKSLAGYVLLEKKDEVVVLVDSRERRIPTARIACIRSASRSLREVLDRHHASPARDAASLVDLALHCRDQALPGEADVFALAALCADPANEDAHRFLGHTKRQSGWTAKRDSGSVLFAELLPARGDFRDPWKLQTSHYSLLTNLSLCDAVATSIDLERFYRTFFEMLGSEVELKEVTAPMGVGLYGDSRSFPEDPTGSGRQAYFIPGMAQVVVDAAAVEPRTALVHEATHQLLHATTAGSRSGLGEIPGWLDEGLAEYLAYSRTGEPGRAHFDLGAIAEAHFATHRDAKKPYDLSRVLTFASGDFLVSSRSDLKYAQAYTLVHFLLHGEQGRYRAKFFAFLRSAYAGGASTTDFKSVVGVPEKELEVAWKLHVRNPVH